MIGVKRNILGFILIAVYLLLYIPLNAQNTKRINKQIASIEKDIAYTRTLIKQTKKNTKTSLVQVDLLDKQIQEQANLLQALEAEVKRTAKAAEQKEKEIVAQNKEIHALKQEYAHMLMYAQKHYDVLNTLMFIFAAKDVNQAYKRLKYFQQYSSYRKQQVELIKNQQNHLQISVDSLQALQAAKQDLLAKASQEKRNIAQERKDMKAKVASLQKRAKSLQKQLTQHNKRKQKLKNKVESILTAEVKKTKKIKATPEQVKLALNFEQDKGRLPWPVAQGVLYSSFGEHRHPVFKQVKTRNDGIDIVTEKGQDARAVFAGEVRNIISVPGSSFFAVLLKHGKYFTLYSNLEKVYVHPGDHVKVKQKLGQIAQDPTDSTTKLQFQIWHTTTKLNPSQWLQKQK